jgi:flagellar motor switch protein FliN/FliY
VALITRLPIADVAAATARTLEALLGHDVVLATGPAVFGDPTGDLVPEDSPRTIVLPFGGGIVGELTLVVGAHFATAMEAVTSDAALTAAVLPALTAGAAAIAPTIDIAVDPRDAAEIATETLLSSVSGEFASVPLFEGDAPVACLVVRIVDVARLGQPDRVAAPGAEQSVGSAVARHEFQPLGNAATSAAPMRPLSLLNDVAMDVSAELGRGRMKVRDIVALQPGSLVELGRAAGSPVDVLVNGALIWRGEVVVVDDDLGVRVSEIAGDER